MLGDYRTLRSSWPTLSHPAALQKPVRLSLEVWAGEPQRGDLTKPRLKAWVSNASIDT